MRLEFSHDCLGLLESPHVLTRNERPVHQHRLENGQAATVSRAKLGHLLLDDFAAQREGLQDSLVVCHKINVHVEALCFARSIELCWMRESTQMVDSAVRA